MWIFANKDLLAGIFCDALDVFFFMSLDRLWKMLVSFCTRLATKHVDAYTSIFGEMEVLMGSREARKASRSQDPNNRIISITYTRRRISHKNHQHEPLLQLQRYNYTFWLKIFWMVMKQKRKKGKQTNMHCFSRREEELLLIPEHSLGFPCFLWFEKQLKDYKPDCS